MRLAIVGRGWVTPLGSGISTVWQRLLAGEEAEAQTIASELGDITYPVFRVPPDALADAPVHPRLRRSSAISRFAAAAGMAALKDGGVAITPDVAERTALIFAIANGGVVYTKRFFHDIIATGAQTASPLLFPETVFNAPASHLAAILGIAGASYTIVGDGAVSLLALQMADDLMLNESLDYCLVVGAEEADWLLCDAYRKWRLLRSAPPIEPFHTPARGMILSEGAGALLLGREGTTRLEKISAGTNFRSQRETAKCVESVFAQLCDPEPDVVVASANGTFVDAAESKAIQQHCANAEVYAPKAALGDSVGAAGIWQVICAAEILRTKQVPPVLRAPGVMATRRPLSTDRACAEHRAVVSACGLNQQVAGARLIARR
jgi:3-oxoacyl-(acyl-carrier-protein) synthase